jgi:diaminopimelate epimerase
MPSTRPTKSSRAAIQRRKSEAAQAASSYLEAFMKFTKAHGIGNDFIIVSEADVPKDWPAWAVKLCDRNKGIGGDGILIVGIDAPGNVARMRLLNPDGSHGEISGNGVRCVGAYAFSRGLLPVAHTVVPAPGPRPVVVTQTGPRKFEVDTDLGLPGLRSEQVPFAVAALDRVVDHAIDVDGETVRLTCCSMGNPHAAIFVDEKDAVAAMMRLGPKIENHRLFPNRTNVEFVTVISRGELRVRFWERGVGVTQASGTGSASALVASVLTGRSERQVVVYCDGGELRERWIEDGALMQRGAVEIVFDGEWFE